MKRLLLSVVIFLSIFQAHAAQENLKTILRPWSTSDSSSCSTGFPFHLYQCATMGFEVSWPTSSEPAFSYLENLDIENQQGGGIRGGDCGLYVPSYTNFNPSRSFIILEYRDASTPGKSWGAQLAAREDGLGFRWRLLNTACEVSFGAEGGGGTLLDVEHSASIEGYQTEETFCKDEEEQGGGAHGSFCAFACAKAGFAVHHSSSQRSAVLVPSNQPSGCQCGAAVIELNNGGDKALSGHFGVRAQWHFRASGSDRFIHATVNDRCAVTYQVGRGSFLGVSAATEREYLESWAPVFFSSPRSPLASEPRRKGARRSEQTQGCARSEREQSDVELRLKDGMVTCQARGQCDIQHCFEGGFYLQIGSLPTTACYTPILKQRASCDTGPECPLGNATFQVGAWQADGELRNNVQFRAEATSSGVAITWERCTAVYEVWRGSYLGFTAAEPWYLTDKVVDDVIDVVPGLVVAGVVTTLAHSALTASMGAMSTAILLLNQVQFIGVVAHYGGRRVLESSNGTKVVLDSVVPDGIQRLSDRTSWLNFYEWGVSDYADRCTTLRGEYELYDVLINVAISLGGLQVLKALFYLIRSQSNPEADFPYFPCWELPLLQACLQGLALAAGVALGSDCSEYHIVGGATVGVIGLVLIILASYLLVYFVGDSTGSTYELFYRHYESVADKRRLNRYWNNAWGRYEDKDRSKTWMHKWWLTVDAFEILIRPTKWSDDERPADASGIGTRPPPSKNCCTSICASCTPSLRSGAEVPLLSEASGLKPSAVRPYATFYKRVHTVFKDSTGGCWWYSMWLLARKLLEGLILGLTHGRTDYIVVLAAYGFDFLVLVLLRPRISSWDTFIEAHTAIAKLVILVTGALYLEGSISPQLYEDVFVLSTIAALVPLLWTSLLLQLLQLLFVDVPRFPTGCKPRLPEPMEPEPVTHTREAAGDEALHQTGPHETTFIGSATEEAPQVSASVVNAPPGAPRPSEPQAQTVQNFPVQLISSDWKPFSEIDVVPPPSAPTLAPNGHGPLSSSAPEPVNGVSLASPVQVDSGAGTGIGTAGFDLAREVNLPGQGLARPGSRRDQVERPLGATRVTPGPPTTQTDSVAMGEGSKRQLERDVARPEELKRPESRGSAASGSGSGRDGTVMIMRSGRPADTQITQPAESQESLQTAVAPSQQSVLALQVEQETTGGPPAGSDFAQTLAGSGSVHVQEPRPVSRSGLEEGSRSDWKENTAVPVSVEHTPLALPVNALDTDASDMQARDSQLEADQGENPSAGASEAIAGPEGELGTVPAVTMASGAAGLEQEGATLSGALWSGEGLQAGPEDLATDDVLGALPEAANLNQGGGWQPGQASAPEWRGD